MSNEINVATLSGQTVYALVMNTAGQVWNTSTEAFESYATANRGDYDISLTEQGTASGIYLGNFPSVITTAGTYQYLVYLQPGGSPAETDTLAASGEVDWTGTAEVAASSGSLTATDWRAYVLRGGFKRTDKDTELYEATTDAVQEMRRRFSFDEAHAETTTTDTISVLGDFKITIESDLGLVIGIVVEDGTNANPLNIVSKEEFDSLYPDINVTSDRGYPKHATLYNGSIYIGSIPDQTSYSYRISYSKRAGNITSTTTAVPFTNLYRDILRDLVNSYLYEAVEEFDRAQYFRAKFEEKFLDATRRESLNQKKHTFTMQYRDF